MLKKALIFISFAWLILLSPAHASPKNHYTRPLAHYALIIDAGSTGSRLHLFRYTNKSRLPEIQDIFSKRVNPGLSSYENNPTAAGESLKPLLDEAKQILQSEHIRLNKVTISVLATAGMRLLPQEKQDEIYANVSLFIKNNYPWVIKDVKTINGSLEGIFGWLDINYLLDNFDSKQDLTQGSIDVGGASTQIVLSTDDQSKAADEIQLTIAGRSYTVFSKSFLGLGLSETLKQIQNHADASSCFPIGYPLADNQLGHYDFTGCGQAYADLLKAHQIPEQLPDLQHTHFIAYSGIFYLYNFMDISKAAGENQLDTRVKEVCSKNWEQLQQTYTKEPAAFLPFYCANGTYISKLLYETYQLRDRQITVTNTIHHSSIDWTLGALLYQLAQN